MRNLVLSCAVLLLCACGGSSASDVAGSKSDLLAGTYRYLSIESVGGDVTSVTTAIAQPDGESKIALSDQHAMSEGVVMGPLAGGALDYAIDGDRTIRLPNAESYGRVTPDGMLAVAAARSGTAAWSILMRRRENVTLADLAGTWMSIRHGSASGMNHHYLQRRMQTVTALGIGEFASPERNVDGAINPPALGIMADDTFTVRPDGSIQVDVAGWGEFRGDLSEDGNLMVFGIGLDNGFGAIQVMVRMENAADATALAGAFEHVGWRTNPGSGTPLTSWGTWDAVAGTIGGTVWFLEDGSKSHELDTVFHPDGHFDASGGSSLMYAVLAESGNYAFFCGGWSDGSAPQIAGLIR